MFWVGGFGRLLLLAAGLLLEGYAFGQKRNLDGAKLKKIKHSFLRMLGLEPRLHLFVAIGRSLTKSLSQNSETPSFGLKNLNNL